MAVGFAVTQAFNSPGASQYGGGGQAINGNGGAASGGIGGGGGGLLSPPNAPTLTLTSNANDNMPDFLANAAAVDLPVGATVQLSAFTNSGLTGSPTYTGSATVTVAGTLALVNTMGPMLDATYWYVAVTAIPGHAVSARSNTVTNTIDTTAPVLSGATSTATGSTTASGSVVTNEASGTLYWIADTGGTPTAAQVKAGQGATGAAANGQAANQAVTAIGTQNILATTLTAGTTYTFYFAQQDAAGNLSAVAASATFTTVGGTTGTPIGLLLALTTSGGAPPPPFAPTDIAGLAFWGNASGNFQDTARTTPASADTNPIGSLTDQSGNNNHLSQATAGARPLLKTAIVGSRNVVRFDGVNDTMSWPSGITLGSAATIFAVTKQSSAASAYVLGSVPTPSQPALLTNFFSSGFVWFNNSDNQPILVNTTDTALHVVVIKQTDGAHFKGYIDGVNTLDHAAASTVAGNAFKWLCSADGTQNYNGTDIVDILVWPNNELSDTDRVKVEEYLVKQNGAGRIVYVGDSLTFGTGATGVRHDYPNQTHSLISKPWLLNNRGVAGWTIVDMTTDAPNTDAMFSSYLSKNVCIVWGGTNDIFFGANAATAYSRLVSYCQARQAAGWTVMVLTMLSRSNSGTPGTFNTDRATFNTNVRANFATFASVLIDVAADANIGPNGAETNATYFSGDLCHLNQTGYAIVANLAKTAINAL